MSSFGLGGPFNVTAASESTKKADKNVTYQQISSKYEMTAINDYYHRGDALITAANNIKSHEAFSQGFHVEYGNEQKITPKDSYDYIDDFKQILQEYHAWDDMYGFFAFKIPNRAVREEIMRQRENKVLTPQEIATRKRERSLKYIKKALGSDVAVADTDPGNDAEDEPGYTGSDSDAQKQKRENDRINLTLPPIPKKRRLVAKETSMYNGNALTAADSQIDFVEQTIEQRTYELEEEKEKENNLMTMFVEMGSIKPINVNDGVFFLRKRAVTSDRDVVFVPNERMPSINTSAASRLNFVDYDENVIVYVTRMPTDDGILQTQMFELMRLLEVANEAQDNASDADHTACHPTPIFQQSRAPVKADATDLPEEDMLGITQVADSHAALFNNKHMTPSENRTYNRDAREAIMLEMSLDAAQQAQFQRRANQIAMGHARATRARRGTLATADARTFLLEKAGVISLVGGMQFGGTILPKPVQDVNALYQRYQTQLSVMLGVPLSYLRGEQMGKTAQTAKPVQGKGNTSHSASTTEHMIRTTVMRYREKAERFFNFWYDSMFRESDTQILTNQLKKVYQQKEALKAKIQYLREEFKTIEDLASLDKNLASLLSESASIDSFYLKLRHVLKDKNRVKLKFERAPLVEEDKVVTMQQLGAISHTEMVNILRQSIGLDVLDERGVQKIFEENMRYAEVRNQSENGSQEQGNSTTTTTVERKGKATSKDGKPQNTDEKETTTVEVNNEPPEKKTLKEKKGKEKEKK